MAFGRTHTDPLDLLRSEAAEYEKAATEGEDKAKELEQEAAGIRVRAATARTVAERYRALIKSIEEQTP